MENSSITKNTIKWAFKIISRKYCMNEKIIFTTGIYFKIIGNNNNLYRIATQKQIIKMI